MEVITCNGGDGINRSSFNRLFPGRLDYPVPSIDEIGLQPTATLFDEIGEMGERGQSGIMTIGDDWKAQYLPHAIESWKVICDLLVSIRDTGSILGPALCEVAGLLSPSHLDGLNKATRGLALQRSAFVQEASEQYLIQVGHMIGNAALRIAIDDAGDRKLLAQGNSKQRGVVNAIASAGTSNSAWPFHRDLLGFAPLLKGSETGGAACVREAASLCETESWRLVSESRNQWFHRTRSYAMGGDGEEVSVRQRCIDLATALDDSRKQLGGFALGCDDASPRPNGNPELRLLARAYVYEFDPDAETMVEAVPQRTNIDIIQDCI